MTSENLGQKSLLQSSESVKHLDLRDNSIGSVANRRLSACCAKKLDVYVDDFDSEEEDDDTEEDDDEEEEDDAAEEEDEVDDEEEEDWPGSSDAGWI